MRISLSKHYAEFTQPVVLPDWRLEGEPAAGELSSIAAAVTKADACAWARRAATANGFGASEASVDENQI